MAANGEGEGEGEKFIEYVCIYSHEINTNNSEAEGASPYKCVDMQTGGKRMWMRASHTYSRGEDNKAIQGGNEREAAV
jgi:hypothetical protein